jgi:peptidoglycan/xylan/chitin deacetylase (PgdA/CDA1 family)
LRGAIAAGCEVGNHTFSHPSLPTLDDGAIRDELERGGAAVEGALGTRLRYWRLRSFTSTNACARLPRRSDCKRSAVR